MTTRAVITHAALMDIILLVTGETFFWRIAKFLTRRMTGAAGGVHMRPGQFEIRQAMIKSFPVQADNIKVTTLMIAMAGLAFFRGRGRIAAMKAGARLDIRARLFMTGNAEGFLTGLGKARMTFSACPFNLLMGLRNRPGHYKCLKSFGMTAPARKEKERAKKHHHYLKPIIHFLRLAGNWPAISPLFNKNAPRSHERSRQSPA
jgi:hypothetical protein